MSSSRTNELLSIAGRSAPTPEQLREQLARAVLSPGDSVFIPKNCFHHVQALDRSSRLVNFWFDATTCRGVFDDQVLDAVGGSAALPTNAGRCASTRT